MLISYHVTITITLSPLEQKQDHPISSDSYVDQQALSVLQADLKSSKSGFMAIKVIILHNVQWMTVYVTEPMFSFHILFFIVVILYTGSLFIHYLAQGGVLRSLFFVTLDLKWLESDHLCLLLFKLSVLWWQVR